MISAQQEGAVLEVVQVRENRLAVYRCRSFEELREERGTT